MSLDTGPLEDDIEAVVRSVVPRVWISEVPDTVQTPAYPYAVIYFGGPFRAAGDHHMTSTRNDTNIAYCTVRVVSETDKSARDVNNRIRNALVGHIPPDSGEMGLEGGLTFNNGSGAVKPTKFFRETGYTFRTNLNWTE
jgi:hypothetical protein